MNVKCPTCGKQSEWSTDNPHRPFCSHRCKLIDLGEWSNESRRIPCEDNPFTEEMDGAIPSANDEDYL